jgi:hypothetical protein
MAIRLASAIGEQRKNVDVFGGLDDIISKTGDAIQAVNKEKRDAAAKKADQEQKLKDAIAKTFKTEPLDKAFPEEKKEYEDVLTKGVLDYAVMQQDPNVTPSELKKFGDDLQFKLEDRKNVYGRAYDAFREVAKKEKEEAYDTTLFKNWFLGKENTQVADMPKDDFMAASEKDRAGKLVGENGMQATETKTTSQTVPYLNKSFEEKKNIDFATKADELVSLKRPDTLAASRGYYGKPFEFEAYTVRTDKVSPTTGEYIFNFDEAQVDLDAKKFASSIIGEGNFGSKEHAQYQRALQNEALVAGNEAGFSGDRLAAFVQETVPQMAYDDFVLNARSAYDKRIKNDKDITKAPSKGMSINFTGGGGGNSKIWNVGRGKLAPLYKVNNKGEKTKDTIGDYYYHSIQTVAGGENPKKFNIAGYTDVQVEGVNVNKKTGKPEYVDITIPARYDKRGNVESDTGIKKTVRITEDTEIENLKTNLGEDLYNGTIGSHKPEKGAANVSMSDEDKQAMDWANANPSDARAKAIKEKLKKKGLIK